jgi:hypothetical protein
VLRSTRCSIRRLYSLLSYLLDDDVVLSSYVVLDDDVLDSNDVVQLLDDDVVDDDDRSVVGYSVSWLDPIQEDVHRVYVRIRPSWDPSWTTAVGYFSSKYPTVDHDPSAVRSLAARRA